MPDAIAAARGNPGKRKKRPPAPSAGATPGHAVTSEEPPAQASPEKGVAATPARLGKEAKVIWQKIAPELARMNLLRATDVHAFERYCEYLGEWWTAKRKLRARGSEGAVYKTKSNHGEMIRLHPLVRRMDRLEYLMQGLEDRFGLTPRARQELYRALATMPAERPLPNMGAGDGDGTGDAPAGTGPGGGTGDAPGFDHGPLGMLNTPTRH